MKSEKFALQSRRALHRLAFAAAVWPGLGALLACTEKKDQFAGIDITGADYAKDFALTDHLGQQRSMKDFRGKVVVLFFGFAQCPDVCPSTMAELAAIRKQLGKDGERLQGLFVTLDPERDSPEVLKAYMDNFDPSFIGLHAAPEQLPDLAKHFKLYYKKVEGKTPTSYSIDHTAGSFVYDTQGRIRLFTRHGAGPAGLLADVKLLLAKSG